MIVIRAITRAMIVRTTQFVAGHYPGRHKARRCSPKKGKDVDFGELLKMEPDVGSTNIRNTASKHWTCQAGG